MDAFGVLLIALCALFACITIDEIIIHGVHRKKKNRDW